MEKESWTAYGLKFGATIAGKMTLNSVLPGLGSTIELAKAAKCFYDGDVCEGVINVISFGADLCTLGIMSAITDAMKTSAKEAVVQNAKEVAKAAGKEATKKVGEQVGKEIARGVIDKTVKEVVHEGSKMTFNKMFQSASLAAISSGGREVVKNTLEDVGEKCIVDVLTRTPKTFVFELSKEAAKTAAEKEFLKQSYKLAVKDAFFATAKGAIRWNQSEELVLSGGEFHAYTLNPGFDTKSVPW